MTMTTETPARDECLCRRRSDDETRDIDTSPASAYYADRKEWRGVRQKPADKLLRKPHWAALGADEWLVENRLWVVDVEPALDGFDLFRLGAERRYRAPH